MIVQPDVPLEQEQTGIPVMIGRVLTVIKVDMQKMDSSVPLAYSGVQVLGQWGCSIFLLELDISALTFSPGLKCNLWLMSFVLTR